MDGIEILPMSYDDIDAVCDIERACFPYPFLTEDFMEFFDSEFNDVLVAKECGRVIGYISYSLIIDTSDIINFAVIPECRGRKIGFLLLDSYIQKIKQAGATQAHLEVRVSNTAAINLYEKYGFAKTGVSKNHYTKPCEDAYRMTFNI